MALIRAWLINANSLNHRWIELYVQPRQVLNEKAKLNFHVSTSEPAMDFCGQGRTPIASAIWTSVHLKGILLILFSTI